MYSGTIEHSFDVCGITQSRSHLLGKQLSRFIESNELSYDVEELDPAADLNGFESDAGEASEANDDEYSQFF